MKNIEEIGYSFAKGVGQYLWSVFFIFIAFVLVLNTVRSVTGWGMDDTDKSSFSRSGLHLYTDAKTGVQYLGDGKGGLTPRIDYQGNIIVLEQP